VVAATADATPSESRGGGNLTTELSVPQKIAPTKVPLSKSVQKKVPQKIIEDSRDYSGVPSDKFEIPRMAGGSYMSWHPNWSSPIKDDLSVVFSVKGASDARVMLSPRRNQTNQDDAIEVWIGDAGNSRICLIVMSTAYESFQSLSRTAPLMNGQPLSATEYRSYWIQWRNSELSVGFGTEVYRNLIWAIRLDWVDAWNNFKATPTEQYNTGIRHVSFSGYEAPLSLKNIRVGRARFPRPAPVPFALGPGFSQATFPAVSSKQFEMVFEVQGFSDTHIGIVNQPHVADDISDPDGYEIVLDARDLSDNLGASRSTRSVSFIRRDTCRAGDKLAVVNNEQPLLSSSEFRPFWISLKDHELRVGTGIVVGADEIMKAKDLPAFKQNTLYLGFLAFNLASAIRIVSIDSPLKPLPANQRVTLTNYVPDRLTDTEYFELSPLTGTSKPWQIPPTYTVPQCPWGTYCSAPKSRHHVLIDGAKPRVQWWHDGAFCAEVAIQSGALAVGMYISQNIIRQNTQLSGNPSYHQREIVPANIRSTFRALRLNVESFNWRERHSRPRYLGFFDWVKQKMVQGKPVLWFVKSPCSEDFSHSQLVVGYVSNHTLAEPSDVNDHVVILEGYDHAFSYSQLNIKVDSHAKFGGLNCSQNGNACLDANVQIGHAMVGLVDPLKRSISTKLYVTDGGQEPIPPLFIKMNATVVVTGPLKVGTVYRVFRFDGVHKIPRDSNFASAGYSTVHTFRAMGATHTWNDPTPILSNSAVAYVTTIGARTSEVHELSDNADVQSQ